MNCSDTLELLSPRLDGELEPQLLASVEEHLASCATCRAEAEALAHEDALIRTEFAARAARVAAATEAAAVAATNEPVRAPARPLSSRTTAAARPPRWRSPLTHLLCVAGGFALATLVLRLWPSPVDPRAGGITSVSLAAPNAPAPAATLVVATGPVEYRPSDSSDWSVCLPGFVCPSDAAVRTKDDALCELKTEEASIVRLDRSTELAFGSSRRLTLRQGKVWCRVPEGKQLEIRAAAGDASPQGPVSCTGGGATWTVGLAEQHMECLSAAGNVVVETGSESLTLTPGEALRVGGQHPAEPVRVDQIAAARWMWPLLAKHGPGNPELETQVHALLSTLGRTKVAYLSELEIRRLGEYGALPVLRFVQTADPKQDAVPREEAMRILADVAPVSFVPAMIDFLVDASPSVRVMAARALLRLTGETQGRQPEDWKMPVSPDDEALISWRIWRDQNRMEFERAW